MSRNSGMDQFRELRKKRLQRRQEVPDRPATQSVVQSAVQPAALHPSSQALLSRLGVNVTEEEKSTPAVATARVLQQVKQQEEIQLLRDTVKKLEQQKWFYATPVGTEPLYTGDSLSAEVVQPDERVLLLYPLKEDGQGTAWVTVRRLFDNGTIEDFTAKFYTEGQPRFSNFTFSNVSCI